MSGRSPILVLLLVLLVACGSERPTPRRAAPSAQLSTARSAESSPVVIAGTARADALEWDAHVGWEPRFEWPPGEVSRSRPEGSYLVLEYSLGHGMLRPLAEHSAGVPLRDKPLIVRAGRELCDAELHEAVAGIAPDRLLLHIEASVGEEERDCLARLPVRDLFVSTCRHDGHLAIDHCVDGDAQLEMLTSSPEIRGRLRGLAIGFDQERSWSLLSQLTALTHLTIRGPALAHLDVRAAFRLCELPALAHVDALIADPPGDTFDVLPPACVMRWSSFASWSTSVPDGFMGQRAPPTDVAIPCRLERVRVWSIEPDQRVRLAAACPQLRLLEVARSQERCARRAAGEALSCDPL
jgi:hypothetical protein